jgi:hypothetical protein
VTTVAYTKRTMVADTACYSDDGIYMGRVQKITRLQKGRLLGICGDMTSAARLVPLLQHAQAPSREELMHCGGNCSAMLVMPDESVIHIDTDKGSWFEVEADYHAIGTGDVIATALMHAGHSAEEAVNYACDLDSNTKRPLQIEVLEEEKRRRPASEKIG